MEPQRGLPMMTAKISTWWRKRCQGAEAAGECTLSNGLWRSNARGRQSQGVLSCSDLGPEGKL